MTQPQQPVARLSERVTKLERQRVTYREATVLAVHVVGSTFDADVAGAGRLDGIPSPPQFMPAVGDVVQLQLSGATPIYQPQRVGEGTIGTTELAGYVTEDITIAMDTAAGKNKVWFSPAAPTVEVGSAAGDPWFKRDSVTHVITGSWEWDGDSWEPRTYGDAVLSSLTVGKLVGGTGTFDLIVGGRIATANTGQRAELNPLGIQGFNSSNALTLHLDGIANLITGTIQTALTGRRIVMGAAGAVGEFNLYSPDGKQGQIRSFTESSGVEAIQFGMLISGANSLWNRINYNSDEWANYRANKHDFYIDVNGVFNIRATSDKGASTATLRFTVDNQGTHIRGTDGGSRFYVSNTDVSVRYPGTDQRIEFKPDASAASVISAQAIFVTGSNIGGNLHFWHDADGSNGRFAFLTPTRSGYVPVWASAFTVNSSAIGKTNRRSVSTDEGIELLRALKVTEFNRLVPQPDGERVASDRRELGVIAEELPDPLRLEGGEELGPMWDLTPTIAALISAAQNLDARLARLEKGVKP